MATACEAPIVTVMVVRPWPIRDRHHQENVDAAGRCGERPHRPRWDGRDRSGSRRADVAVDGGRIVAIEPDLSGPAAAAAEVIDATGLLVLPGVVDVHTHTRVASDAEPDRFFQDSVAAAFGGTTTFLAFNNPGTGSSAAAERSLAHRPSRVAGRDRRRQRDRLRPEPRGQRSRGRRRSPSCRRRSTPASRPRRRSWSSTSGSPTTACSRPCGVMGRRGGMLQVHCEDPVLLDAAVADALQRGDVLPRYHATTRPSYVEAVATARALAFARMAGCARSTSSTCRRRRRSTRSAAPRRPGSTSPPRPARTTSS